ncbi:SMI1/KNR4 family protein [Nocardia terpenica]|uniref:SMI1/KNR4 family protein n=1 Tax=Nocardia terpenica TaxID=455432 RepID=UPI001895BC1B|nr:SMI1/KNR4 family protein [Nocardia terpenica]MBF6065145.1 SMI1/KNR4 family protein [Nocardia terpenica]MBF6107873.1 SMI1/KNR4 family protein [Nocardia terpenica]MBF6115596.1 SMI1/KNR4 family protein [Nocardia terpenica]MBF6122033.1 SMI1/KNR4 family protein [Nocardia terpenica]MBF6155423.1 SMI1/KNR4 family protein [Nocardia terpenica]
MKLLRTSLFLIAALTAACTSSRYAPQASPSDDWCRSAISELTNAQRAWYEKGKAEGHDDTWMLTAPKSPADDASIQAAENRLGVKFDDQFKDWLHHVNGWEDFSGAESLLPVGELSRDSVPEQNFRAFLAGGEFTPNRIGVDSFDQLVVIGGAEDGSSYIAIRAVTNTDTPSMPVYTFSHGDFLKHDDFKSYIQSEINLLKQQ